MSVLPPTVILKAGAPGPEASNAAGSDRRADVDAKQQRVADFLSQIGCEGLLILDQANLAWLTSGAVARSILDPGELPGLYFNATQRWLLASNVESQRMFDEELDGLGFLLKEWPWHWRRDQLLADLCQGRTVAADVIRGDSKMVGPQLRLLRRAMTPYEQACCFQLGEVLIQALEATCRFVNPGDTEREIAGQLSHRLLRRGAIPVALSVAADGRSRLYRRHGFTSARVEKWCVASATVRKYGLCATATRTFSFGPVDDTIREQHFTACKVAATYTASTWPDAMPQEILNTSKRVYLVTGFEHEWHLCPQGHVTGRVPVELSLGPETTELLRPGWVVTWGPTVGAAAVADTFLISEAGPQLLTPTTEGWPLVSVRVSGGEFKCPHILER
jgi:Xaa-Pro aminopeptidase